MVRQLPKKLFFKIGEVCEITDTQPYVLRFWESEFSQLAPRKNRSGQRIYTNDDVQLVERIKQLLYDEGYTIAGARKQLEQIAARGTRRPDGPATPGRKPARKEASKAPSAARPSSQDKVLRELRKILVMMEETDDKLSSF